MTSKPKSKQFERKGKGVYDCTLKNGRVTVRLQRTAKGQSIIAGAYNLLEEKWENESPRNCVPTYIKEQVEEFFT